MSQPSSDLPGIALITPSFNQAAYLEQTLQSVYQQNYPGLEHVVMDGGSTDASLEIIRRYADRLKFWTSEKDAGQYDAIRRGFAHTQAPIMGWLNSDDLHLPWTLRVVGEIFASFPQVMWLTSAQILVINERGIPSVLENIKSVTSQGILRGEFLPGESWYSQTYIQQESTFWRRELWEKVGGLDPQYDLAGDFALWLRFAREAPVAMVMHPLAVFRSHPAQRSRQRDAYRRQALAAIDAWGCGQTACRQDRWRRVYLSLPWSLRKQIGRLYTRYPSLQRIGPGVYVNHCLQFDDRTGRWMYLQKW